jgi:hypothetical protein
MNIKIPIFLAAAALLSIPAVLLGHHGQAAYESTSVTIKGTVTAFRFVNPHCIVEFETKDDKGQVQKWQGELNSPNRFVKAGWTETTLRAGDEITITGYRLRSGANTMWITTILLPNGQELKRGRVR